MVFKQSWNWDKIAGNPSLTVEIINRFPDKRWNWSRISENKCLTLEFLNTFPDKEWNWSKMSHNVTLEMVDTYIDKPWSWTKILCYNQCSLDIIKKYFNKLPETYRSAISNNVNITLYDYYTSRILLELGWNPKYDPLTINKNI